MISKNYFGIIIVFLDLSLNCKSEDSDHGDDNKTEKEQNEEGTDQPVSFVLTC